MKYSPKLVDTIVDLLQDDMFTIAEICEMTGISRKTYYKWLDEKPEFKKEVDRAKEYCEDQLAMKARKALNRRLDGYSVTETIITYVPDEDAPTGYRVKKKVVKMKEYPPDTATVKHLTERADKRERDRKWEERNKPEPRITFEDRLEKVKQQYGYYSLVKPKPKEENGEMGKKETIINV